MFLARFDITWMHVPGSENAVADALSRVFDNPNAFPKIQDYSHVDLNLDEDNDDLPSDRIAEQIFIHDLNMLGATTCSALRDIVKPCTSEAAGLSDVCMPHSPANMSSDSYALSKNDCLVGSFPKASDFPPFEFTVSRDHSPDLLQIARNSYKDDAFFAKILENPEQMSLFEVSDKLIFSIASSGSCVLCLPRTLFHGRSILEMVIDQAHQIVSHHGPRITTDYVRQFYWWPSLARDVRLFCDSCSVCQATKTVNKRPQGLLHSLPIPHAPWCSIAMDFTDPFPESNKFDYLWVVLDRLTSLVHLIPTQTTATAPDIAFLFIKEVVRLHGLPTSIVSDHDPKFTSKFWLEVHHLME
jgi:hypothetical protein